MSEFIVHSVPGSPYGRTVFATLEEKRADYRLAPVTPDGAKREPHLSRHPFGRVPVLEHDGLVLYETQAILRYIDRVLPTPALSPRDPRMTARMDQIMNVCDWYLFQGVGNVIGFQRIRQAAAVGPARRRRGSRPGDAEGTCRRRRTVAPPGQQAAFRRRCLDACRSDGGAPARLSPADAGVGRVDGEGRQPRRLARSNDRPRQLRGDDLGAHCRLGGGGLSKAKQIGE